MKKNLSLFLLVISFLSFGFPSMPVKSEAKFVSGYTDGLISTYAIIEYNGVKYKTDETGARINQKLWNELSDGDKRQLMKYYWSPNTRKADFGAASSDMAGWANNDQGWTKLIDELKQKRANKNYPDLKEFFDKPLEMPQMPNVNCTEQIATCDLAKEAIRLDTEIRGNYQAGSEIYKKLVDIKWDQVSVAVKGISANLIPVIVDNFMTSHITNGAKQMSQLVAQLYQFADQTRQAAQSNPNDAAALIKKLDTLCEMMETDARTAKSFVENDREKLQSIYTQLAKLCEEDYKNKQKFEEEKRKSLQSLMHAPTAETGLRITSGAEKPEDREREIQAQVLSIYTSLSNAMATALKEAEAEFGEISADYSAVKGPSPIKCCDGRYPESVDSYCFNMYYSVKEIKEWEADFPRGIAEIKTKLESDKEVVAQAKASREKHAAKIKSIQARINELISKYGAPYLPYIPVNRTIEDKISYYNSFIEKVEKEITGLETALKEAEDAEKITKNGLKARIDREINEVRPYSSLEANFINSLYQIRDAVSNLDKLYSSEELIILNKKAHRAYINQDKIKEVRAQISLLPGQAEKDAKIKEITDRLKEKQKEENHQIKRLIAGQNNALYDYQKLDEFLSYYTQGHVYTITTFKKVKQDVMEVTGAKLKDPYYDIVEDWQNGDFSLWMTGSGSSLAWWIDPETLRVDIDYIVEFLDGKNQYYNSLDVILAEIKNNKTALLAMDAGSFGKKYNEYSSNAYKIIQDATNRNECTDQVNKNYISILNALNEIHSVILTRERVKAALPILAKDVEDAKALLASSGSGNPDYDGMAARLQQDIKEGTEAYYAKDAPALAPLFEEIGKLIPKLQNAVKQAKIDEGSKNLQKIQEFYISFKQAYESKSESQVVGMVSDNWGASEGTTVSDLENNLRRIFSIFDSVTYNISGLNIMPMQNNIYRVSYDVEITGHNYERDLTHREKSTVSEEVVIDGKGKVRINRTLNGRYWYIE